MDDAEYKTYLFKPVQPLFPSLSAPYDSGKISVNLQFIIPGLHVAEKEKNKYSELIKKCLDDVWDSRIQLLKSKETEAIATLIEIAFYINESEENSHRSLQNKSRLLIERFLGILSFSAGIKLCAKNIVPTIIGKNSNQMILIPQAKTEMPKVRFSIPNELCNSATLSNEIFSALFWLRRGLAESDPIDTYNAFMVCLQILARDWWDKKISSGCAPFEQTPMKCPYCKNDLPNRGRYPPITSLFREYVVSELGASKGDAKEIWGFRNAIAAHGNEPSIDADDFLKITELKFKAAEWAYQGVSLALGLTSGNALKASSNFFVTDSLMHLD